MRSPEGKLVVKVQRLPHGRDLPVPQYASEGASGLDLCACVDEPVVLAPGQRRLIPTGLKLEIPPGCEGQVRPRSGLALEHGITLLNTPGTVDSDYRGEVQIVLANLGSELFTVRRGDRIAQLVICPVERVVLQASHALGATSRGEGGFGHSGLNQKQEDT